MSFTAICDKLKIFLVKNWGESSNPRRSTIHFHPKFQQILWTLWLIVNSSKLIVELNDVLLQLFSNFPFFFQQINPSCEDMLSPFDQKRVWVFKLVNENNFVFKQIVVICDFIIELKVFEASRLKLFVEAFHLFLRLLGPVSIKIQNSIQSRNKYFLYPSG